MPPTRLKKGHTVTKVEMLPLLKKLKNSEGEVRELARVTQAIATEDLGMEDISVQFDRMTGGESLVEFIELAGREANVGNARIALHLAILHANEFGQPGQGIREVEAPPPSKRQKIRGELEQRIQQLEGSRAVSVDSVRSKVRSLALQAQPSDALLLMYLDELAAVARRDGDDDADTFDELARQAAKHQGTISIAKLCLSVLGGKASDMISKAIAKCVRDRPAEGTKLQTPPIVNPYESPLTNLYPQVPMFFSMNAGGPTAAASLPSMGSYYQGRYGGVNRGRRQYYNRSNPRMDRPLPACFSCGSTQHFIKDCDKAKNAKVLTE